MAWVRCWFCCDIAGGMLFSAFRHRTAQFCFGLWMNNALFVFELLKQFWASCRNQKKLPHAPTQGPAIIPPKALRILVRICSQVPAKVQSSLLVACVTNLEGRRTKQSTANTNAEKSIRPAMSQQNQHLTHAMLRKPATTTPKQFQTTWCLAKMDNMQAGLETLNQQRPFCWTFFSVQRLLAFARSFHTFSCMLHRTGKLTN